MMLDARADVNQESANGKTALMEACEKGMIETVKLLIEKGADMDSTDEEDSNGFCSQR